MEERWTHALSVTASNTTVTSQHLTAHGTEHYARRVLFAPHTPCLPTTAILNP